MKFWFLNLLGDFGTNITSNTGILDFGCGMILAVVMDL